MGKKVAILWKGILCFSERELARDPWISMYKLKKKKRNAERWKQVADQAYINVYIFNIALK